MKMREAKIVINKTALLATLILIYFLAVPAMAYEPTGSPEDLYRLESLPLLRPGVTCKMFSSYDRKGGNDDGFSGTYSKLRLEKGDSVLAEMNGPGCIKRIWFTHSNKVDGLLERKNEHIKIYIDGNKLPVLDEPLEKIFSGDLPQFPKPLVGCGLGGFYCYVPISYKNGCKILVEGNGVRFYQITYEQYASSKNIASFSMQMNDKTSQFLADAVALWSSPGNPDVLKLKDPVIINDKLNISKGSCFKMELPGGAYFVRAIVLTDKTSPKNELIDANIQVVWDDAKEPAINIPLSFLFMQAFELRETKSILSGYSNGRYYNYVTMPYQKTAQLCIEAKKDISAKIKVVLEPFNPDQKDFGYFHADYNQQIPTNEGVYFEFLQAKGKGHYLGTFLVTKGKADLPWWLEGDETFHIDGTLDIHGTGSEDYFNCGWYGLEGRLNNPGYFPIHGFPVFKKVGDDFFATAYRWHISDPVAYQENILVQIEHGPDNKFSEEYQGVCFYYDSRP